MEKVLRKKVFNFQSFGVSRNCFLVNMENIRKVKTEVKEAAGNFNFLIL